MNMDTMREVLTIVLFFVIRLGIPALVVGVVGWGLRRLDERWEEDAQRRRREALSVEVNEVVVPAVADSKPCWEVKACPDERKSRCPAFLAPALPCWIARRNAEGCLPDGCPLCVLFRAGSGYGAVTAAGDD
jgi:hypothetical protein